MDARERSTTDEPAVTRRGALRGVGAALAASAGAAPVAGDAGVAAAQSPAVSVVDLREDGEHRLPDAEEVVVFVHGWFGTDTAMEQTRDLAEALADAGHDADRYVALQWDAVTLNYPQAESDTVDVGLELANLVRDYDEATGGTVRLVGHSLGGRVVYEALRALDGDVVVTTAAPMGTAADGSMVTEGGRWYDGIEASAIEVRNYHSERDSTVGTAYGGDGDTALGAEGAPEGATTPENYVDVDVSDSVDSHRDYADNPAVAADLAEVAPEHDEAACAWYAFWCWLF